jgi:uncharacterized membrane protein YbhN (UPF0104 family)
MKTFLKIFSSIFLGVGVILSLAGLAWLYNYYEQTTTEMDDEWIGIAVLIFMGVVFSAIGGGILYYLAKQKARRELLKSTGRKLRGIVSNTYYDTSITYRSGNKVQHPLVVECVAEQGGRKQTFKSENVWGETPFEVGKEITIYIDTRDSRNYWVETGE